MQHYLATPRKSPSKCKAKTTTRDLLAVLEPRVEQPKKGFEEKTFLEVPTSTRREQSSNPSTILHEYTPIECLDDKGKNQYDSCDKTENETCHESIIDNDDEHCIEIENKHDSSLSISLIDHEIQVDEWERYPLKECPHIETQEEVQDHWTPTEVKERKDEDPPTWKRTVMEHMDGTMAKKEIKALPLEEKRSRFEEESYLVRRE